MITYGAAIVLPAIARLVTAQPRRVLVATVAFLALAIGFGVPVTGKLSVDPDLDFVDPSSESTVTYDELRSAVAKRSLNALLEHKGCIDRDVFARVHDKLAALGIDLTEIGVNELARISL